MYFMYNHQYSYLNQTPITICYIIGWVNWSFIKHIISLVDNEIYSFKVAFMQCSLSLHTFTMQNVYFMFMCAIQASYKAITTITLEWFMLIHRHLVCWALMVLRYYQHWRHYRQYIHIYCINHACWFLVDQITTNHNMCIGTHLGCFLFCGVVLAMIHLQVHLQIPCYDFYPVQAIAIELFSAISRPEGLNTVVRSPLETAQSRTATGGVYKWQGRNQRELMTHTY